jgi:hypothetical protein
MAINEDGGILGVLAFMEIRSAYYDGGMRVWRYNEWHYTEGTLYIVDRWSLLFFSEKLNAAILLLI